LRARVAEQQAIADAELVAAGMTAEVAAHVKDENARVGALLAIKVSGREARHPRTHDHKVVVLVA